MHTEYSKPNLQPRPSLNGKRVSPYLAKMYALRSGPDRIHESLHAVDERGRTTVTVQGARDATAADTLPRNFLWTEWARAPITI